MIIKRNINFKPEKRKSNGIEITKNVPIKIRLSFLGNKMDLYSGFRVDIEKWDDKKQRVKNSTTNAQKQSASDINTALSKQETIINDIFKHYEVIGEVPTVSKLRDEINEQIKPKEKEEAPVIKNDFFEKYDIFMEEGRRLKNWTEGTIKKLSTVRSHINEFDPNIQLDDFTHDKIQDYLEFLLKVREFKNTTLQKHFKYLKWFLKWGVTYKYISNADYVSFSPKIKNVAKKVIFLTKEEIDLIKNFPLPKEKEYLDRVRDVLIFSCFSSLRYSDIFKLTKADIGDNSLEFITQKTDDNIVVEFNKYSREILVKYKDSKFPDNKALPVISNQKYNDYLKELGELVGLNQPIKFSYYKGNKRYDEVVPKFKKLSSHIGRRSFICNGLYLGIPVHIIMKWTGHSDYDSMKPYIDLVDSMRSEAMEKFNEL
ncbi:site-specific integrase [Sphingobacterium composti Ten et al. 2007 non Yoo et al. 2007]|uniref:site-specific integrase n=1 Tax=Sphingobacterium composti TaxID=363260 RepID=UPI001358F7CC|nr:site-specific integrase [Sphingobacterium composti Ten et al. 2007 non Yoo et al. 2007]